MTGQAGHAMAFDSHRGVMVLHGTLNDRNTWELHGDQWRVVGEGPVNTGTSTVMAFDALRGVTVLALWTGDIWEWDGLTWTLRDTELFGGQAPTAAVFDPGVGATRIFTSSVSGPRRVFHWNGATITEGSLAGLPNVAVRSASYIASRGVVQALVQPSTVGQIWESSAGGGWTLIADGGPSLGAHLVYDPVGQKTLVLASVFSQTQPRTVVWRWDGSSWSRASSVSMAIGQGAAAAFDMTRNKLIVQGGDTATDSRDPRTFELSEGRWRRNGAARPSTGTRGLMVHDPDRGVHVLFTGATASSSSSTPVGSSTGEVWEWNGAQWTNVDCNGLFINASSAPAAAYDAARRNIVVIGASPDSPSITDTWTYADGTWTNAARGGPRGAFVGPMAFDPLRNLVIMIAFDGMAWEWNGSAWNVADVSPRPPATSDRVAAFDAALGMTVVHQTINGASQTWGWNGSAWQQLGTGGPAVTARMPFVAAPADAELLLLRKADAANRTELWAWSGGGWSLRSAALPFARTDFTAAYDVARRELLTVGSGLQWIGSTVQQFADLGDWRWKNGAWEALHEGYPAARAAHAMAYDPIRGETVLFGGRGEQFGGSMGDTWTWDGVRWRLKSVDGPTIRSSHAMTFDAARGLTVLFGGRASTSSSATHYSDTWTWDGAAWTRSSAEGPSPRYDHVMAYDPQQQRVVLNGGRSRFQDAEDWIYDGESWSPIGGILDFGQGGMCFDEFLGVLTATGWPVTGVWRRLPNGWVSWGAAPGDERNETYSTLVYDPIAQVPLRSGGVDSTAAAVSSVGAWSHKPISHAGPGSNAIFHAAVFDTARGRMVRFGGGSYDLPMKPVVWEWTSTFSRPQISLQPGWRFARDGQTVVITGAVEYAAGQTTRWYRGTLAQGLPVPVPPSGEVRLELPAAQFLPNEPYFFQLFGTCCDAYSERASERTVLYGDTNCDGFVTIADIGSFVTLLTTQQPAPGCFPDNGDCNDDGFITVADIGPFVLLLTGG